MWLYSLSRMKRMSIKTANFHSHLVTNQTRIILFSNKCPQVDEEFGLEPVPLL